VPAWEYQRLLNSQIAGSVVLRTLAAKCISMVQDLPVRGRSKKRFEMLEYAHHDQQLSIANHLGHLFRRTVAV